jgi:hypothetical protein
MKKTILLPLFLGLLLAGCSRTSTDAQKVSSTDQTDPNKPTYNDQAITAKKNAADQSQVAATPTPAPANTPTPAETAAPAATPSKDSKDATSQVAASSTPASAPSKDMTSPITESPTPASTETKSEVAANPTSSSTSTPPANPEASQPATTPTPAAPASTDMASNNNKAKPDLSARLTEWKLTPDDIKSEVDGGQVVRSRTAGANEPTGPMDTVLSTQITSKLQENSDTSSAKIDVTADKGIVTLKGSAQSLDQIGKAIALSLDTPGVTQTIAQIKLGANP